MITRQQFILNKSVSITSIIFKNNTPLQDVDKLVYFKEVGLSGNWEKKEFRYSFDNASWTNWATLTQLALSNLNFTNQPDFYIEVKYTRSNYNTANITDFYLFYDADIITEPTEGPVLIDADLLQSADGEYYLNRANHSGSFTDLTVDNVDASGVGVFDSRTDTQDGTNLRFKTITGANGITVLEDGGTIVIDGSLVSGSGGADIKYVNNNPTVVGSGGIDPGSTFFAGEGKTFIETVNAIFYPSLEPNLTPPSSSFNNNANTLYEIGTVINLNFTASFNRGTIDPSYGTSGFRAGLPYLYYYQGVNLPVSVSSNNTSNTVTINNYIVNEGAQVWQSRIAYNAGEQPLNSVGEAFDSPYPGGITTWKSLSIEGVYPLYSTKDDITTLTKEVLYSMSVGNNIPMTLKPETSGYKQSFAISDPWLASRSLLGIETYNTFTQQWEYEGGSATVSLTRWTVTQTSRIIQGATVNYTKYTYNGPDRSSVQIRLKF